MSGESRPPAGKPGATPPSGDAAGADPSMEDILASIRRILNEEEAAPPADPAARAAAVQDTAPAADPPEPDDALTLSEDMLVSEPEPAAVVPAPVPTPASPPPPPPPVVAADPPPVPTPAEGLLAPAAAAAATASLGTLLRTVAAERSAAVTRGGPTIEDVVREEIRPMLKEWLDHHLPPLVERLVRAEIERVVGRALP